MGKSEGNILGEYPRVEYPLRSDAAKNMRHRKTSRLEPQTLPFCVIFRAGWICEGPGARD
eukprot:2834008-Pyramimonas_sp.AAC.1